MTWDDTGDEFDPEQAEREIQAFLDAADALGGPAVADLAAVGEAWAGVERAMAGVPNNKLIATMLLVSRQARETSADDPRHWQLHAASTLLSGLIGRAPPGA